MCNIIRNILKEFFLKNEEHWGDGGLSWEGASIGEKGGIYITSHNKKRNIKRKKIIEIIYGNILYLLSIKILIPIS